MATQHSRTAARIMMAPAVVLLLGWMLVPLTMTLYFSFKRYLPLRGGDLGWVGFDNYVRFFTSSSFWPSVGVTLLLVGGVLLITVVLGVLLALLLDQPIWGQGIVRILVIAPTASLVWTVESTRWPVRLACTAISAVSRSRISPIMMMSGSCRRMLRSARAKLNPTASFT